MDYKFTNFIKVEIELLQDELNDIYLMDLSKGTKGGKSTITLCFNKDVDIIDIKKLKYLFLYDHDMGNFNAHLNCISKCKKDITSIRDFTGAYHGDEHIVQKITK